MNTLTKSIGLAAMLVLFASVAHAADPVLGTWKLDGARSTFKPGPAPKSQTRTYVEAAEGIQLAIETVAADGSKSTVTTVVKPDGKDHPMKGNPDFDALAVTARADGTVDSKMKKGGKIVGTGVRSISADGKTLTFKTSGTHADGKRYEDTFVYSRQ